MIGPVIVVRLTLSAVLLVVGRIVGRTSRLGRSPGMFPELARREQLAKIVA